MLTQTSELAIKALLFLGLRDEEKPVAPRVIAEALDCSPTYLAKTLRLLARAGILRAQRGAHGGANLGRAPEDITLRQIVEACQGVVVGNYCTALGSGSLGGVCAFHRAMHEVYEATVGALDRWTLADLIARPDPRKDMAGAERCKMLLPGSGEPRRRMARGAKTAERPAARVPRKGVRR